MSNSTTPSSADKAHALKAGHGYTAIQLNVEWAHRATARYTRSGSFLRFCSTGISPVELPRAGCPWYGKSPISSRVRYNILAAA